MERLFERSADSCYALLPHPRQVHGGLCRWHDMAEERTASCSIKLSPSSQEAAANSYLTVNGKSRSGEEIFSKYFVNVDVILNFKKKKARPFETDTKGRHSFIFDASLDWATTRRWRTKLLDRWKVAQRYLLRRESVNETVGRLWSTQLTNRSHCVTASGGH